MIIGVAQPFCVPGDVDGNLARMEPLLQEAADVRARLVLFGEAGVTGYEASSRCLDTAIVIGDDNCRKLNALACKYRVIIAAGFWERSGTSLYNTHGLFYPEGRLVVQRKARRGPPEESVSGYKDGPDERTVFEVDGVMCAVAICADSGIPNLYNTLARQGVQLLLVPTGGVGSRSWGYSEASLEDPLVEDEMLRKAETMCFVGSAQRTCRRHRIALAACNQMADDGVGYFHPGHSSVVDSTGELAALIPGVAVFEHLRPRVAFGEIHPQQPVCI